MVSSSPHWNLRVKFHSLIIRLATKQHLPVAGHRREWVEQGARCSPTPRTSVRLVESRPGVTLTRSSRARSPLTCPSSAYERPELVINLKTAKALGLTIPPSMLGRADQRDRVIMSAALTHAVMKMDHHRATVGRATSPLLGTR